MTTQTIPMQGYLVLIDLDEDGQNVVAVRFNSLELAQIYFERVDHSIGIVPLVRYQSIDEYYANKPVEAKVDGEGWASDGLPLGVVVEATRLADEQLPR
jgi:hypothetical protein